MSKSFLSLCAAALLAAGLSIVGCHSDGGTHDETIDPATGQRRAVRHFCPQHPQVTSMGPDKCRVCGNLLVPEK